MESANQIVRLADREDRMVARAQRGDARAWATLYRTHLETLYRDVRYLVRDAAAAEEITQEAFARALTSLSRYDARASFRAWLRGIAHNLVRRHWRTSARRSRALDRYEEAGAESVAASHDPESHHLQRRRAQALSEVLTQLPEALRETFVMRDVQGLSVDDVAERLGTSANNVRVRTTRARQKIRARLAELGWLEAEVS